MINMDGSMKIKNTIHKTIFILSALMMVSFAQSNLSVHGYLSQGFAISNGNQIFGITKKGTFDYRNLALQFRYDYDSQSNIIVQFSHKRLGASPLMKVEEDVELDWAYFGYQAWEWLALKVGKIQLPFGIYNELRDVGVLLPFYQVPYACYGEGNWMSETIDGTAVTFYFARDTDMPMSLDLYAGQWKWVEWLIFPNLVSKDLNIHVDEPDIKNAIGFKFWMETPLEGIQLGLGGYRGDIIGGVSFGDVLGIGKENINVLHYSFDGNWYDYYLRSELTTYFLTRNDIFAYSFYMQSGYRILENLFINAQGGLYRAKNIPLTYAAKAIVDIDYYEDYALSFTYAFLSNFVFKIEGHWNRGYLLEDRYMDYYRDDPFITQYGIISVSASF